MKMNADIIELPISTQMLKRIKAVEAILLKDLKINKVNLKNDPTQDHTEDIGLKTYSRVFSNERNIMNKTVTGAYGDVSDENINELKESPNKNKLDDTEMEKNNIDNEDIKVQDNTNGFNNNLETKSISYNNINDKEIINDADNIKVEEKLFPLNITDMEASTLIEWYKTKISEKFIKTYPYIEQLIEKSQISYNPIWLSFGSQYIDNISTLIKENSIESYMNGLTVLYIDPNSQIKSRIFILHASIIDEDEEKINIYLNEVVNYIWTKTNCDEIRIELTYFMQNSKLSPYHLLKDQLQKLKFKWKVLINDQEGNRKIVLGIDRPEDEEFSSIKRIDCKTAPITFKQASVFAICEKINKAENNLSFIGIQAMCCYLEMFKKIINKSKEDNCELVIQGKSKIPFIESLINLGDEFLSIVYF